MAERRQDVEPQRDPEPKVQNRLDEVSTRVISFIDRVTRSASSLPTLVSAVLHRPSSSDDNN